MCISSEAVVSRERVCWVWSKEVCWRVVKDFLQRDSEVNRDFVPPLKRLFIILKLRISLYCVNNVQDNIIDVSHYVNYAYQQVFPVFKGVSIAHKNVFDLKCC